MPDWRRALVSGCKNKERSMQERQQVVLRFKNIDDAAKRCADELVTRIASLAEEQPQVVIALCGGSSPVALYQALADSIGTLHETVRSKLRFVPLDERCVEDSDPDHNLKAINAQLFETLARYGAMVSWQICWYHQQAEESAQEALAGFNDAFASIGNKIDVVVAGVGPDGHIASLFPGLPASKDTESISYLLVENSPKPPATRISASRKLITDAAITVGIFTKGKEEAYANFRTTHVSAQEDCPAKLLALNTNKKTKEPKLFILTDIIDQ